MRANSADIAPVIALVLSPTNHRVSSPSVPSPESREAASCMSREPPVVPLWMPRKPSFRPSFQPPFQISRRFLAAYSLPTKL
jgi:hypothetical protein